LLVRGDLLDARERAVSVLSSLPQSAKAWELVCETLYLADQQELLLGIIETSDVDVQDLPAYTQRRIAETLLSDAASEEAKALATSLLTEGDRAIGEERELRRTVLAFKRLGRNKEVVELLNKEISRNKYLERSPNLLEIRAKSKLDIAKQC